jgi:hypothetical protein
VDKLTIERRLTEALRTGERVALQFNREYGVTNTKDPSVMNCYIGQTNGRVKCFIMLKRRDSDGGYIVSADELQSVTFLGRYR